MTKAEGGDACGARQGRTRAGVFRVPRTPDMFETLSRPWHWGPAEAVVLCVMGANVALLALRAHAPLALYVAVFAFWRAAYNAGLGALLCLQSDRRAISRWLAHAPRGTRDLLKWSVTKSLPPDYKWARVPVEFNAWIAFRSLAMLVLANDGLSYLVLAAACFRPWADSSPLALVICNLVGSALVAFSFWSKAAAHHCLGDFAWYWGDFFFTMEGELVFHGVFELFPHPMYTVGYSAYYGISLITRSYTLLYVSLLAHAAQIAFLILVEEPHIRKTYGDPVSAPRATLIRPVLPSFCNTVAAPDHHLSSGDGVPPVRPSVRPAPMVGLWRPSVYRVGDVALCVLLACTVAVVVLATPSAAAMVLYLLAWRALHWLGLGSILSRQADGGRWIADAHTRGISSAEAFDVWTQLWNTSWVMNHAVFALTALTLAPRPLVGALGSVLTAVGLSHFLGGLCLIAIAIISCVSAYETMGYEYGFFYADFFELYGSGATWKPRSRVASYKGVYRYVNNPECVLGYLAYYGLAVMLKSWSVFLLAFVCQAAHATFIYLVEAPHLARTHTGVRNAAALERTLLEHAARVADKVPVVARIRDEVQQTAERSKTLLSEQQRHVSLARERIVGGKEKIFSEIAALNERLREHKLYLRAVELRQEACAKLSEFDGEEILTALARHGIVIERISDSEEGADEDRAQVASTGRQAPGWEEARRKRLPKQD